jgi:hypothetical protein
MPTTKGHTEAALRRKIEWLKKKNLGFEYRTPILYSRDDIERFLLEGKSLRQVAKIVGCSAYPVQVVRKELVKQGKIK